MNRHSTWPCAALLLGVLFGTVVWAQAPAPTTTPGAALLAVPRGAGAVVIDGQGDDPIWATAASVTLPWEVSPRYVEPTTWKTQAKVVHDGKMLYVLVIAEDPEPDRIQSRRVPHDGSLADADYVNLRIDPNASNQRAYVFSINAEGSTADYIEPGAAGDGASDWTGRWQGAARRTATGYTVEFAIPLSTMGVAPRAEGEDVGVALNVARFIGRGRKEEISSSPLDYRLLCGVCQYQRATLQKVDSGVATWQVTPYGVASVTRTFDPLTRQQTGHHTVLGIGTDLLLTKPGGHRLLATINPDFSEVSPDNFQIEVNRRFATIGSEARPFYADNLGFFSPTPYLVNTWLLTDPSWAAQYIYRGGDGAIQAAGAMFTHDRQTTIVLPGRNGSQIARLFAPSDNTLARWRWFPDSALSLNGTVTSRLGSEGYSNTVAALDGTWQPDKRNQFNGRLALSLASNPESVQSAYGLPQRQQDMAGSLNYSYSGDVFSHYLSVSQYGKDFRSDMGTLNRTGVRSILGSSSFNVQRDPAELINSYSAGLGFSRAESTAADPMDQSLNVNGSITFRGETSVSLDHSWDQYWVDGKSVPSATTALSINLAPTDEFSVGGSLTRGTTIYYVTGTANASTGAFVSLNYRAGPRWLFALSATGEEMKEEGTLLYRTWVANGALVYTPSSAHRFRAGVNYRDTSSVDGAAQDLALQLQYAYRPGRFTWFYVGYNGAGVSFPGTSGMVRTSDYYFAKFSVGFDDAWFGSAFPATKR